MRTRGGVVLRQLRTLTVVAGMLFGIGCGQIADPDNIKIAKLDDKYITRGDLYELVRNMSDTDRPKIRNRNDFLRILNEYIDNRITLPLGRQLAKEEKIAVDREAAREKYFQNSGDRGEELRNIWRMEIPKEATPSMKEYTLTPASMKAMKESIEIGTDRVVAEIQGEQALVYLAVQAMKQGGIQLNPEALAREYRLRKNEFKTLEWMKFVAIRFPAAVDGAAKGASGVRDRLRAGESFDTMVKEYLERGDVAILSPAEQAATVMQSEIENNPELVRFRGFWTEASGAEAGDIIGPVYMPQYQQVMQDGQGRTVPTLMPDSYLVLKVVEHKPEAVRTLEQCTPLLAPPLLVTEVMKKLRRERGVEVYEDHLPSMGQFRSEFGKPLGSL